MSRPAPDASVARHQAPERQRPTKRDRDLRRDDGMAVFDAGRGRYTLIQNHELDPGGEFGVPHIKGTVYDPGAVDAGGCTVITTDRAGRNLGEFVAISGTVSNCAGGPTPWGTWPATASRAVW